MQGCQSLGTGDRDPHILGQGVVEGLQDGDPMVVGSWTGREYYYILSCIGSMFESSDY